MAKPQGLRVSPDLTLPLDFVTKTIALLAIKRAGKSNGAAVMAEEMFTAGLPFVAIDPKGDWWGLRSSADGTGPGLPIPVFGGLHGDLPLTPESGKLLAELVFEHNLTCILDVSEFESKAAQMRFLTDFGRRLFQLHGREPQPRMLILEEADDFIPQRVGADQAVCVGVWTKIVKQGGQRGLGITIISQRSAVVNKDALSQVETLIALRTTGTLDRKAISDWVRHHQMGAELVASLDGLADGEAWICSPYWLAKRGDPPIQRFRFRQRSTFDSGATPEIGQIRRPSTRADIDLTALGSQMQAITEKVAQDDPAVLRRRIAELERQLRGRMPGAGERAELLAADNLRLSRLIAELETREPEKVEVPALAPGDIAALEQALTGFRDIAGSLELALSRASAPVRRASLPTKAARALERRPEVPTPAAPAPGRLPVADLKPSALRVLQVLAGRYPMQVTRPQLATLAKMKHRGGAFQEHYSSLRKQGLITDDAGLISVTPAGMLASGVDPEQSEDLREVWRAALGSREWQVLEYLLGTYPASATKADIAEAVGMTASGGAFQGYLGTLRANNLIHVSGTEVRADDVFFVAEASQ